MTTQPDNFGFGEDEDGELYVLTSQSLGPDPDTTTGEVFRIFVVGDDDDEDDDDPDWDVDAVESNAGNQELGRN